MISFLLKPRFHMLLTVGQNSASEIGDPAFWALSLNVTITTLEFIL